MSHAHEPPEPPALYAVRDDLDTDEPHDLPAEQAVIGSMLLSTQAITDATDTLYGTEFYRHAHELIWHAAINLHLEGAPVDTVTVAARLQEQGDLGRAGGAPYLHELITGVVSPASASYYAQIVRDRAARRALRAAGRRIHHLAGATGAGGFDAIAQAATEALTKATADHTATGKTTSTWQPVDLAGIRQAPARDPRPPS
jgi:replicative DNA helicase